MNITDETLSAFLDAELPEAEMDAVRDRIAEDEQLALRLAELAAVDQQVQEAYGEIDHQPMPEGITRLLRQAQADDQAPQIKSLARPSVFPAWAPQWAMAASIAFVAGFGLNQWFSGAAQETEWASVASALDSLPSGVAQQVDGATLAARVSFRNADGGHCRQYDLQTGSQQVQAIACKTDGQWVEVASLRQRRATDQGSYQTASGSGAINALVDQMAVGNFYSADDEARAIANQWVQAPESE